jgi:glycosyltransferase involved in cell wall biosynthesis
MRRSILFVRPDYHCSFFYRDEFRRLGWKADIYVPSEYPEKLLYSGKDILRSFRISGSSRLSRGFNFLLNVIWYLSHFWRYKYHFINGRLPAFSFQEKRVGLEAIFGKGFLVSLWLAKICGCKIIYLPTGCRDEETKENFSKLDGGNVCNNCGWAVCDDRQNNKNFDRVRRYADMAVGIDCMETSQYPATHFKYRSIDLNLWKPDLDIPPEHLLPATKNLRVLHFFYTEGRNIKGRNIKGSPYIFAAIKRLRQEGHAVEYICFNDKPPNQMRFYQAQADIVVEQLIYGWWGSSGVETMALGKPVICYLRPQWKSFFLKKFPEYPELPIVEANTETIYEVLKKLVVDQEYRQKKGRESREFAESFFNPSKNAKALADLLLEL